MADEPQLDWSAAEASGGTLSVQVTGEFDDVTVEGSDDGEDTSEGESDSDDTDRRMTDRFRDPRD